MKFVKQKEERKERKARGKGRETQSKCEEFIFKVFQWKA
jgi:hypothetical protein